MPPVKRSSKQQDMPAWSSQVPCSVYHMTMHASVQGHSRRTAPYRSSCCRNVKPAAGRAASDLEKLHAQRPLQPPRLACWGPADSPNSLHTGACEAASCMARYICTCEHVRLGTESPPMHALGCWALMQPPAPAQVQMQARFLMTSGPERQSCSVYTPICLSSSHLLV